jgi:hypothetical protein
MTTQERRQSCQATDNRGVVGEGAVAGEFVELVADQAEVVERVGPLRMPRQLRDLPGRQGVEDFRGARAQFLAQHFHFASMFTDWPVLARPSSAIFASRSAIGCSKSRKFGFMAAV